MWPGVLAGLPDPVTEAGTSASLQVAAADRPLRFLYSFHFSHKETEAELQGFLPQITKLTYSSRNPEVNTVLEATLLREADRSAIPKLLLRRPSIKCPLCASLSLVIERPAVPSGAQDAAAALPSPHPQTLRGTENPLSLTLYLKVPTQSSIDIPPPKPSVCISHTKDVRLLHHTATIGIRTLMLIRVIRDYHRTLRSHLSFPAVLVRSFMAEGSGLSDLMVVHFQSF